MSLLERINPKGGSGGGGNEQPRPQQGGGGQPAGGNTGAGGGGGGGEMQRRPVMPAQRPGDGPRGKVENTQSDLKMRVQNKLLAELDQFDNSRKNEIRMHIEELFNAILAEESMV